MVTGSLSCVPTSLGASLVMLPYEFGGTLIYGMENNGHPKVGVPEISLSRKTVAPKNRSRAMLQDRLTTHPRPWRQSPRRQLQGWAKIQSADRDIPGSLATMERYMGLVRENVTQTWSPDGYSV